MPANSTGFAILLITAALYIFPEDAGRTAAKAVKSFHAEMAKD